MAPTTNWQSCEHLFKLALKMNKTQLFWGHNFKIFILHLVSVSNYRANIRDMISPFVFQKIASPTINVVR